MPSIAWPQLPWSEISSLTGCKPKAGSFMAFSDVKLCVFVSCNTVYGIFINGFILIHMHSIRALLGQDDEELL